MRRKKKFLLFKISVEVQKKMGWRDMDALHICFFLALLFFASFCLPTLELKNKQKKSSFRVGGVFNSAYKMGWRKRLTIHSSTRFSKSSRVARFIFPSWRRLEITANFIFMRRISRMRWWRPIFTVGWKRSSAARWRTLCPTAIPWFSRVGSSSTMLCWRGQWKKAEASVFATGLHDVDYRCLWYTATERE